MPLSTGTKLGPYEILGPIGAGGMGEVYRARDTRLGRDVAIKVLPASLAKDADRLRRFEQEARTVATLSHPNILAIHDIGTYDGAPFLVSELLDGETLRQKIEAGPLPARRAIDYSLGIAHGLAAAHDKGVVHRDLKPENVIITRDGRAKILDFGLAKLARLEENTEIANTLTSPGTLPGVTLGTIGYMSPEQVRGTPSDARSDIFSFGVVLYEMLTGKRAFKRDTAAESMTAILREEPPELHDSGFRGPVGLQRILARCLEKNVEQRFQSASDLAFAIEALSGSSTSANTVAVPIVEAPQEKKSWWPWAAAAAAAILLAAAGWLLGHHSSTRPGPKYTRLTYQQGYVSAARFAKGSQTVVYSAQWDASPMQIYTMRLEFPQSSKVDLPTAALLAVSQSGDVQLQLDPVIQSNFLSGTLAQAPIAGGTPRSLQNAVIAADFAPDGKLAVLIRTANQKVQLEFPVGKVLFTTSGYVDYARVSPDGKSVAFLEHPVFGDDRGWVATLDESGHHKQLTREFATSQGLAWSPDGQEVWFTAADGADRQLYAVTTSGKQRVVLAAPQGMRVMDISPEGRVLLASEDLRTEIAGIDPATGKERRGLEWFNGSGLTDITPDGRAILFNEWGGPAGPLYLVVYRKLDGSAPVALGDGALPRFSPDGKTAAAIVLSRPPQVALHPIGAGYSRLLSVGALTSINSVEWFPDGQHLLLTGSKDGEALRSYVMDVKGGGPEPIGPADFLGSAIDKSGKKIAGYQAGDPALFDRNTQKLQSLSGIQPGDFLNAWTLDGQGLIVTTATPMQAQLYRVEVTTGKKTPLLKLDPTDPAGSTYNARVQYAQQSKTYAYNLRRTLDTLYVVEGLQ